MASPATNNRMPETKMSAGSCEICSAMISRAAAAQIDLAVACSGEQNIMSEDVLGPIGLLAALMGAERGLDVHVFGRNNGGPREALVRELGGTFHSGDMEGPPRWIETRYPHGMHGRDHRHSRLSRRDCAVWDHSVSPGSPGPI